MILTALFLSLLAVPSPRVVDFDTEIIPVLTRAGCNAGSCHGAAAGRGGFHLSLLGSDPAADHFAIVQELEGRRVNLTRPNESLILAKPTGFLSHKGGVRFDTDSPDAKRITDWITAGAPRLQGRRLTSFEVAPVDRVVDRTGVEVPLRASARFNDGAIEDVTAWTVFTTTDPAAIELDPAKGYATVRRRGQHTLIARFLDRVVPVRLTLPLNDVRVNHSKERRASFIDDEVLRELTVLRIPISTPANDAAFLRRVRLDLTGRLPTPDDVEAFLADHSCDKREKLVDRLLQCEEFADYWTYRFAKLLRVRTLPNDRVGASALHRWLREHIHQGTPLDVIARKLITSVGDTHAVGPAYFTRLSSDARDQAELVAQVFLGVRLQCANCHNHPLDRWTQDDYHGLAAVFARLERGREVKVSQRGAVTNPRTGEPAVPRIPGVRDLNPASDGRGEFAGWLTTTENPYFARATVNRLWRAMFGRGLVEPVDDLRDTNPATHPQLLRRLADDFVMHRHDVRHTLRLIALSETYSRGAELMPGNTADDRFHSRAYRRPLEAEVIADAMADVTGVSDQYGSEPVGTRAVMLFDPKTPAPSLDILGRCSREDSCEGTATGAGLPAKLHQLNGELINRKIASPDGRLHRAIAAGRSDEEIITEFYLRALCRRPTTAEWDYWKNQRLRISEDGRTAWLEDAVWSLLSCSEFRTNH
jgi:hypothetical protein